MMPTTPQHEAGTRIDPPVSDASALATSRAATAEAGPLDDPPVPWSVFQGLRGRSGNRVMAEHRRAGRELRHVKTRDVERAGGIEPLEDMRRVVKPVIREYAGAAGTDPSLTIEHVLVGERDAMKRPPNSPCRKFFVGPFGVGQGGVGLAPDDGAMVPPQCGNPVQAHAGHLGRIQSAAGDLGRDLCQAQAGNLIVFHGRSPGGSKLFPRILAYVGECPNNSKAPPT